MKQFFNCSDSGLNFVFVFVGDLQRTFFAWWQNLKVQLALIRLPACRGEGY